MTTAWELLSPHIRRVLAFEPAVGLFTTSFVNRDTGTDLVGRSAVEGRRTPEFDFCLDGERYTSLSTEWELADAPASMPFSASASCRTWLAT